MGHRQQRADEALAAFVAKVEAWSQLPEIPRLLEALTHPSYAHEHGCADNQRLEFLGDSVLGLLTSERLAEAFLDADEGVLSRFRSQLVSAEALAEFALREALGSALRLGRGAQATGEGERVNVLADAVEAVVAAVYFAGGLEAARRVVDVVIRERLSQLDMRAARDPKSELQERVQAEGSPTPRYEIVGREGPVHRATFTVEVKVGDEVLGTGSGPSKKAAERAAAEQALAARDSSPS